MESNRAVKKAIVQEISAKIAKAHALVIAEYHGLTVTQIETLKKELKAHDVELKVYKNRLFKIASAANKLDFDTALSGPNTFAFGMSDDIAPAKILANFAKNHQALKIKAGTYEGKVLNYDEVMQIATLPTHQEALEILARSMIAPLQQIAIALDLLVKEAKVGKTESTSQDVNTKTKSDDLTKTTEGEKTDG